MQSDDLCSIVLLCGMQLIMQLLMEEKFLELLEKGNKVEALRCLRVEIGPLAHCKERIQQLSRYECGVFLLSIALYSWLDYLCWPALEFFVLARFACPALVHCIERSCWLWLPTDPSF